MLATTGCVPRTVGLCAALLATLTAAPVAAADRLVIAVVVDDSRSMCFEGSRAGNDPDGTAAFAAYQLVRFAPADAIAGVFTFGSTKAVLTGDERAALTDTAFEEYGSRPLVELRPSDDRPAKAEALRALLLGNAGRAKPRDRRPATSGGMLHPYWDCETPTLPAVERAMEWVRTQAGGDGAASAHLVLLTDGKYWYNPSKTGPCGEYRRYDEPGTHGIERFRRALALGPGRGRAQLHLALFGLAGPGLGHDRVKRLISHAKALGTYRHLPSGDEPLRILRTFSQILDRSQGHAELTRYFYDPNNPDRLPEDIQLAQAARLHVVVAEKCAGCPPFSLPEQLDLRLRSEGRLHVEQWRWPDGRDDGDETKLCLLAEDPTPKPRFQALYADLKPEDLPLMRDFILQHKPGRSAVVRPDYLLAPRVRVLQGQCKDWQSAAPVHGNQSPVRQVCVVADFQVTKADGTTDRASWDTLHLYHGGKAGTVGRLPEPLAGSALVVEDHRPGRRPESTEHTAWEDQGGPFWIHGWELPQCGFPDDSNQPRAFNTVRLRLGGASSPVGGTHAKQICYYDPWDWDGDGCLNNCDRFPRDQQRFGPPAPDLPRGICDCPCRWELAETDACRHDAGKDAHVLDFGRLDDLEQERRCAIREGSVVLKCAGPGQEQRGRFWLGLGPSAGYSATTDCFRLRPGGASPDGIEVGAGRGAVELPLKLTREPVCGKLGAPGQAGADQVVRFAFKGSLSPGKADPERLRGALPARPVEATAEFEQWVRYYLRGPTGDPSRPPCDVPDDESGEVVLGEAPNDELFLCAQAKLGPTADPGLALVDGMVDLHELRGLVSPKTAGRDEVGLLDDEPDPERALGEALSWTDCVPGQHAPHPGIERPSPFAYRDGLFRFCARLELSHLDCCAGGGLVAGCRSVDEPVAITLRGLEFGAGKAEVLPQSTTLRVRVVRGCSSWFLPGCGRGWWWIVVALHVVWAAGVRSTQRSSFRDKELGRRLRLQWLVALAAIWAVVGAVLGLAA